MRRVLFLAALLFGVPVYSAPIFMLGSDESVILNVCIPALDGEGFLHVDEDVSGLAIEVIRADGTSAALYDAGTEIEDVAAPGTGAWTAPSANNVRASPDGNELDCTELQFADGVFDAGQIYSLRVTDGQTTIMDYEAQVVFLSSSDDLVADVETALSNQSVDTAADRVLTALPDSAPGALDGLPLYQDVPGPIVAGTSSDGSTTTLVDESNLDDFASDYFNNLFSVYVEGIGAACIRDFDNTSDATLTFDEIPDSASAQDYSIRYDPTCMLPAQAASAVQNIVVDGTVTLKQAACYLLAVMVNDSDYDEDNSDAEFFDPTGMDVRVTITYTGSDRSTTLEACGS